MDQSFCNLWQKIGLMGLTISVKKILATLHQHQKSQPDVFIFSLPRSGSTMLAEVLNTDPSSKLSSEPFSLLKNNRKELLKCFAPSFLSERYVDLSDDQLKAVMDYVKELSAGKRWNSYYWTDILRQISSVQHKSNLV